MLLSVIYFSGLFLGDMRASVIEPQSAARGPVPFSVVYFTGLFLGDIEEAVFGGRFSGLFLGEIEERHHLI